MAKVVQDDVLGAIKWDGDRWLGAANLPYFFGSGERVFLTESSRAALGKGDRFPLRIETGKVRRKPDELQRVAWKKILDRGDALWDEAMDALIAEYRAQRPMRVRYWNVVNSPKLLEWAMPVEVDRATMKQMVIPNWCTLEWPDAAQRMVNFFLILLASWSSEPLNVYVRDGRVTEVVPMGYFMNRRLPRIDAPVFGPLRRRPEVAVPWGGEARLDPFRSFAAVAMDRSSWDKSYSRSDEGTSDLPWNVARGRANLYVYAPPDKSPSAAQTEAYERFISGIDPAARKIIAALSEHHQKVLAERGRGFQGPRPELSILTSEDARDLKDITELKEVNVFPDEDAKPIAIGLIFRGSWTGNDGVGVRWRDGKVEQVGEAKVADPERYQHPEMGAAAK